jgi:SAM-dependent methyltransferase
LSDVDAQAQRDRVQRFYDRWTPAFIEGFGTTFQAGLAKPIGDAGEDPATSARVLAARAGVRDGDRILDAGCGVCGPAIAIADAYARVRIHAVTLSSVQVQIGKTLVAEAGLLGRVTIERADFHHLPFADGSFDVVLILEACGYSPDRSALFAETARVLRPGGHLYVKDVFARSGALTDVQKRTLVAFDNMWHLASSPTLPEAARALIHAGCDVVIAGELPNVGTDRFVAAMVEPDPDMILRLSELGRAFGFSGPECPTFFGEVLARRRE